MTNFIDRKIDKLSAKIKYRVATVVPRLRAYFTRLLFPVYLFPVKLVTYSIYYLIKFLIKLTVSLLKILLDMIVFPFRSLKNFLKSAFVIVVTVYLVASLFVIADYLKTHYGFFDKFICSVNTNDRYKDSVVRVVGGYSEGSGFFVAPNQVLTNFHVIADEPSPKIIFSDGTFVTATRVTGDKNNDLALIYLGEFYPDLVKELPDQVTLYEEEPLVSTGFALGTDLKGPATVLKGNFVEFRTGKAFPNYIQTDINIVKGMSGGPLTDVCGKVVGINTLGISGLSLFISADSAKVLMNGFTDRDVKKIEVDPSKSPEEAVRAFYTYLKARRMRDGFNLLSREYLKSTDFVEWTNRFRDVLDFDVIRSEKYKNTKDTAFVKFSTKNWVDNEVELHYYEGIWATVKEDGVFKMLQPDIIEVYVPSWQWFYE